MGHRRGGRAIATVGLALALALMLGSAAFGGAFGGRTPGGRAAAVAQDDVATGVDVLLRATLPEAPPSPAFFRLLRITLSPGASIPAHTHPGPELSRVESGAVSIAAPDQALVVQSNDDAGDPPAEIAGEDVELRRGDQITFPTANGMGFANTSDRDATLLSAVVLPAGSQRPAGVVYTDGTPPSNAFTGVLPQVLGDGTAAAMPAGEVVIQVDRLTLGDGDPIPAAPGPVLVSLAAGALAFTVDDGLVQISRTAQPGPQPEIAVGTLVELTPGDAAFFSAGMAQLDRPEGSGEVELLRMSVLSSSDASSAATPAPETDGLGVLSFEAASALATPTNEAEPEPDPDATQEPGDGTDGAGFAEGDLVVVTEDEVRLRAEPSTEAEIVSGLDQGAVLQVTGPAVEGSGFVWYPVVDPNDATLAGFVVEDFLAADDAA